MWKEISQEKKQQIRKRIKEISEPKTPIQTSVDVELKELQEIKAVLFDVYGTILCSGVEPMQQKEGRQEDLSIQKSWDEYKVDYEAEAPPKAAEMMHRRIKELHEEKRQEGVDYPEVDIITVWDYIMKELKASGDVKTYDEELLPEIIVDFVIHYDQPWPMPGISKTLDGLKEKGMQRGIISNSQFYSPLTLEAICEQSLEELGFNPELNFWSFSEEIAKPSVHFYEIAEEKLKRTFNIQAEQVLFVGNDMQKDVYPAHQVGFKTALFAGDIRSLRMRENDERCKNLKPDITIQRLEQILECV